MKTIRATETSIHYNESDESCIATLGAGLCHAPKSGVALRITTFEDGLIKESLQMDLEDIRKLMQEKEKRDANESL